jgi:hypothetical protein
VKLLALAVLVVGFLVIQADFTKPDVPFQEHEAWRDYVTVVLFAAAVAVLRLRPVRMQASLCLALAGFTLWFGIVA